MASTSGLAKIYCSDGSTYSESRIASGFYQTDESEPFELTVAEMDQVITLAMSGIPNGLLGSNNYTVETYGGSDSGDISEPMGYQMSPYISEWCEAVGCSAYLLGEIHEAQFSDAIYCQEGDITPTTINRNVIIHTKDGRTTEVHQGYLRLVISDTLTAVSGQLTSFLALEDINPYLDIVTAIKLDSQGNRYRFEEGLGYFPPRYSPEDLIWIFNMIQRDLTPDGEYSSINVSPKLIETVETIYLGLAGSRSDPSSFELKDLLSLILEELEALGG